MKASELRIGNWVKTDTGREYKIELSWFDCCKDSQYGRDIQLDTYPIPLTEEWLVKFGFGIDGVFCYLDFNPRMQIRFHNGNSAECDIVQDGKYIAFKHGHIQYVHSLQNLYFALTGKELEYA